MTAFLYAEKDYSFNDTVLALGGETTTEADPRRIQVRSDLFILPPRLLRHSCSPNTYINWDDLTLRAEKHITKGDLVTYHYATSELDYTIGAFQCECDSSECLGYFKGFAFMKPEQQAQLYGKASPYIRSVIEYTG